MMNPDKERRVSQKREDYCQGHDITYNVAVKKFRAMQSWPFKKEYFTECRSFPTVWFLELDFLLVREDASGTMSVTLKRKDSQDVEMEAVIWVQICNYNESLIFPKQNFSKLNMLPGDVLQETVEVSPLPGWRGIANRSVVIHISIMTSFCHDDDECSDNESADTSYSDEY